MRPHLSCVVSYGLGDIVPLPVSPLFPVPLSVPLPVPVGSIIVKSEPM